MTLGAAMSDLNHEVEALRQEMAILHTAILVDRPPSGDVVLIDLLGDAALDALDLLNQIQACAAEGQQSANGVGDLARSAQALAGCGAHMSRLSDHLYERLLDMDRLMELLGYSKRRGGEWRSWSLSVKDTLSRCPPRFSAALRALLACWQELVELSLRRPRLQE
jgi:hypothetical protein